MLFYFTTFPADANSVLLSHACSVASERNVYRRCVLSIDSPLLVLLVQGQWLFSLKTGRRWAEFVFEDTHWKRGGSNRSDYSGTFNRSWWQQSNGGSFWSQQSIGKVQNSSNWHLAPSVSELHLRQGTHKRYLHNHVRDNDRLNNLTSWKDTFPNSYPS